MSTPRTLSRKQKNDLILILVILAGCVLYYALHRTAAPANEVRTVVISVGGEEVYHGSLGIADGAVRIKGINGGSNVFVMEKDAHGNVGLRCTEADCPDLICVHTGLVVPPDEPIVCLPHRVTARIID